MKLRVKKWPVVQIYTVCKCKYKAFEHESCKIIYVNVFSTLMRWKHISGENAGKEKQHGFYDTKKSSQMLLDAARCSRESLWCFS